MLEENSHEEVTEKLTLNNLLGSLSEEEKTSLKKYYTTGEQDDTFNKLKDDRKFFISLGIAAGNDAIGNSEEELKEAVLSQLG